MKEDKINFAAFASSNWTEAPKRYTEQLAEIECKFHFFKKSMIFNEKDLGEAYNKRFSRYFYTDHGFAYFSWKPMVLLKALEKIEEGEFLFYMDGGCRFPMERISEFLEKLSETKDNMVSSDSLFGLTFFNERPWPRFPGFPNVTIVKKEILNEFGLENDLDFLFYYPHWQAGLVLLRKNKETVDFLKEWYLFFLENYELCVRGGYKDRTGQHPMFIQNGSDQAILQCMLYTKKTKIQEMNFIHDFDVIKHIRK